MRQYTLSIQLLLSAIFLTLFSGCGVGSDNFSYEYSVKVSALHYVKDADVTDSDGLEARYREKGIYDFNKSIKGVRTARGGLYIVNENNESNSSNVSLLCKAYLPTLNTDTSLLLLSAPEEHPPFQYININPFTTLLTRESFSKEMLAQSYPIAASIEENFDFDTVEAREAEAYNQAEHNLTKEICDALEVLHSF